MHERIQLRCKRVSVWRLPPKKPKRKIPEKQHRNGFSKSVRLSRHSSRGLDKQFSLFCCSLNRQQSQTLGSQENNQKREHVCGRCPKHQPNPESLEVERHKHCCSKLGFLASPHDKSARSLSQGEKCLGFPGCVPVLVPSGTITHHHSRPVAKHRFRC